MASLTPDLLAAFPKLEAYHSIRETDEAAILKHNEEKTEWVLKQFDDVDKLQKEVFTQNFLALLIANHPVTTVLKDENHFCTLTPSNHHFNTVTQTKDELTVTLTRSRSNISALVEVIIADMAASETALYAPEELVGLLESLNGKALTMIHLSLTKLLCCSAEMLSSYFIDSEADIFNLNARIAAVKDAAIQNKTYAKYLMALMQDTVELQTLESYFAAIKIKFPILDEDVPTHETLLTTLRELTQDFPADFLIEEPIPTVVRTSPTNRRSSLVDLFEPPPPLDNPSANSTTPPTITPTIPTTPKAKPTTKKTTLILLTSHESSYRKGALIGGLSGFALSGLLFLLLIALRIIDGATFGISLPITIPVSIIICTLLGATLGGTIQKCRRRPPTAEIEPTDDLNSSTKNIMSNRKKNVTFEPPTAEYSESSTLSGNGTLWRKKEFVRQDSMPSVSSTISQSYSSTN